MSEIDMTVSRRDMRKLLGMAEPAGPADQALIAQLWEELLNDQQGVIALRRYDLGRVKPDDIPY